MSERKLTFNSNCYSAFQNVRAIMEELNILLNPNKEHKKVFPNVPVIGFRNGKSLKDFLLRATLPKLNGSGRCEPCGKKTCLVCHSISTATTCTTETCQEIQSGPLICDSKNDSMVIWFFFLRVVIAVFLSIEEIDSLLSP